MGDLKKVGRVGLKTLGYFEVVSTVALAIGLFVGEIVLLGKGLEIDPTTLDAAAVSSNVARAHEDSVVAQLLAIIPGSFLGALAGGTCSRCWSHRCFPALPSPGRAPPARASTAPSTSPAACSRSEEHTSELQSLMRISYAVFCLKKKKRK